MRRSVPVALLIVILALGFGFNLDAVSVYIDIADTESYHSFQSHVGYRIAAIALMKLTGLLGCTNNQSALIWNLVFIVYLWALLVRVLAPRLGSRASLYVTVALVMTPSLMLLKGIFQTDFYAGVLGTHALLRLRAHRQNAQASWGSVALTALLIVVALNVKETVGLLFVAAALVGLWHAWQAKRPMLPGSVAGKLVLCVGVGLVLQLGVVAHLFNDPWYQLQSFLNKPKGGSGVNELAGARASVPVPLFFYHVFSLLKTVGRHGVTGLLSLVGLLWFRRDVGAQVYAVALCLFSILAIGGSLTMERYWYVMLPIQVYLAVSLLAALRERGGKAVVVALMVVGVGISLVNHVARYYPETTVYRLKEFWRAP